MFMYIMSPALDLLGCLSPTWSLSMNIHRSTSFSFDSRTSGGILPLHPHKNMSNYICESYDDQYWDRKGQMLAWSYAWDSDNPWSVVLPLNVSVLAMLNMMIKTHWYWYQCTLSQSSTSLLLLRTYNKMPNMVPMPRIHPIQNTS